MFLFKFIQNFPPALQRYADLLNFIYRRHLERSKANSTKGQYKNHVVFFWPFLTPHSPFRFYVFFRESPSPQKTTRQFWKKKCVFSGRLFSSQRTGYPHYFLHFMKEIGYHQSIMYCALNFFKLP